MLKSLLFPIFFIMLSGMHTLFAQEKAQMVINKAIEVHGGDAYQKAHFAYDFRDRSYAYFRNGGDFLYTRNFKDKLGNAIIDSLSNTDFKRYKNGKLCKLTDKDRRSYSDGTNSVHYFAFLPYFLNDPAVFKKYLGEVSIKGEPYHKIRITFAEEGGGTDFEDIFVYWIHTEHYTMDYLAYSYEVDGGGRRFREAYNPRVVGDIRFQDYVNYKSEDKTIDVTTMDRMFDKGELKELSRIELKNIRQK